nr:MFS transporter [Rhodococcus sp. 06-621-2]
MKSKKTREWPLGAWLSVIGLGSAVTVMGSTIINAALPSIADNLNASVTQVQWTSTAYLLGLMAALPISGWATDRFGARRVWEIGLWSFFAASVFCALSPTAATLVGFRALQGVSGGLVLPVGQTILVRRAPAHQLTSVLAGLGAINLSGPALGPLLGGMVVDHFTWRWIFAACAPVAVLAVVCSRVVLPQFDGHDRRPFDAVGAAMLTAGVVLVVFGLNAWVGQDIGIPSLTAAAITTAGIGLIMWYLKHAGWLGSRSLIDLRRLRSTEFCLASTLSLLFGALMFGMLFVLPLAASSLLDTSGSIAGASVVPQAAGCLITLVLLWLRRGRIPLGVVPAGMVLVVLGTLPFVLTDTPASGWTTAGLVIRGIGLSAVFTPATAAAYRAVGPQGAASASTVVNLCLRIGGALGTALSAALLQRGLGEAGMASVDNPSLGAKDALLREVQQSAFHDVFLGLTVVAALALIPAVYLWRVAKQ